MSRGIDQALLKRAIWLGTTLSSRSSLGQGLTRVLDLQGGVHIAVLAGFPFAVYL